MSKLPHFTARDALDLIEAGTAPLDFGTGVAVYRAAVKRLSKTSITGLPTTDLAAIPIDLAFVDLLFTRIERNPPVSANERRARADWKSRLRTIARLLEGVPVVRSSAAWDALLAAVKQLAKARNLKDQMLIPVTSTIRQIAVADGREPSDLTQDWLVDAVKKSSKKRRGSVRQGTKLLNDLWPDLPENLRPPGRFAPVEIVSKKRKSYPLPRRILEQLEAYLARRVAGITAQGFVRNVTVKGGLKADQSTNIYRQAVSWLFDSLCVTGKLTPDANLELTELANLEWLSKVAFEALADETAEEGDTRMFPWQPICASTIYIRTSCLVALFESVAPSFMAQQVELFDSEAIGPMMVNAAGLQRILGARVSNEMTYEHRTFCRALITEQSQQRLLLNMHMICWADAQKRWKTFEQQQRHERMQTMNLCILSAILALVVHIPFRARTLMEMTLQGSRPDITLPKCAKRIEFHIAAKQMKVPKDFDAVLVDARLSRPRQILDWFIAGPRQELLMDSHLLWPQNRRPDQLFCGVGRARYNRILVEWTEEIGMRMTTHLFRHALASILINCCGVPLSEVANLLGNSVATTERQYVFQDLIRRRSEAIQSLSDHREHLAEAHHPGRRRKR